MAGPNLTLGVLVFNQGAYIEELLESILNQSDQSYEMLIIDNCSTDDSLEEIQAFLAIPKIDKHVKVIANKENTGSAAGLRRMLEECDTRYLAVIHGDDILEKNYVEIVRAEIESNSRIEAFNLTLAAFGNDSSVESLKLYVKEKLEKELNPQELGALTIGTFEYKLYTLFVP